MGLFEKTRNITDTDLRILVERSSSPEDALRRHVLSLEESLRQLRSSQDFLARQTRWLEDSAERKLALAEEWEKRALSAARQSRDDLARHALVRKKELLRSMSEDRRELERILPQLHGTEERAAQVKRKIRQVKVLRARLFGGAEASADGDGAETPLVESASSLKGDTLKLTERERAEIDDELRDLKRRLNPDDKT